MDPGDRHRTRFADAAVLEAHFDELALRRREVEDVLSDVREDLWHYVVSCIAR